MIKKIILKRATQAIINKGKLRKFVAKGGKIKKLPAQKAIPVFKNVEAQAAQTKFVQKFGENPGFGAGRGLRIEEASELGGRELAASTARAKWHKTMIKFVDRTRARTATAIKSYKAKTGKVSKKQVKALKIKSYEKAIGAADQKALNIYQKTSTMFTGRTGVDPLKHKLVDTKFITTKKYRKGKPKGVSERDLLWAPRGPHGESFSKLSGAAWHERQRKADWFNKPETIEALAKGKTTRSKVYGAWLRDEAKRRQEFAQSFIKVKKKKK